EADRQSSEPVVFERSLAIDAASDCLGDSLVQCREVDARGRVEVVEALGDRPVVLAGAPHELRLAERAGEAVRLRGELFELCAELIDLRSQRWSPGRRH